MWNTLLFSAHRRFLSSPLMSLRTALLIVFWALFLRKGIVSATRAFFYFDTYSNGQVAKNIALGYGWIAAFPPVLPFPPRITTGPAVVAPVAFAFRLFGATPSVLGLAMVAVNAAALLILMAILSRQARHAILLPAAGALFAFPPEYFFNLLGEPAAACLFASGAVILFSGESRKSRVAAGLLMGTAAITKALVAWSLPPVVLLFVWHNRRDPRWLHKVVAVVVAAAVPLFVWTSIRLLVLYRDGLVDVYWQQLRWFLYWSSGLSKKATSWAHPAARITYLLTAVMAGGYGRLLTIHGFLALALALTGLMLVRPGQERRLITALYAGGAGPLLFWMIFDPFAYFRRITPALFCLVVAAVWTALHLSAQRETRALGWILLAWILLPRMPVVKTWTAVPRVTSHLRVETEQAARALARLRAKSPGSRVWAPGYYHSMELAFLLPEAVPFAFCQNDTAPVVPGDLFITKDLHPSHCPALSAACAHNPVFRNAHYEISLCTDGIPLPPR